MKQCAIVFCGALLLLAGCSRKDSLRNTWNPLEQQDTIVVASDSVAETAVEEEPMPLAADELFDDFIFNFASSRHLQLERIDFPLLVNSGYKMDTLQRKDWKMDYFFMKQDFYTLIFDSPSQMELMKDTAVKEATLERIFLDDDYVRQYLFSRSSGRWMLREIRNQTLPRNHNAAFLTFYKQFASDSLFQRESLAEQIEFTGPDPDDDFQQIDGVITPDFWEGFAPEFPKGMLYNIVYGNSNGQSSQRILVLRGIANGLEVEVTFQLTHGRWKLIKLFT